jgi:hypothetical protein
MTIDNLEKYHPGIRILHKDLAQDGSGLGGWEREH